MTFFPFDIFIKAFFWAAIVGVLLYLTGTNLFPEQWAEFTAFFEDNGANIDWRGLGDGFEGKSKDTQGEIEQVLQSLVG